METDTYNAKTHLSRLLDQVERGEEVMITRRGKRIARLVRYEAEPAGPLPVVVGLMQGLCPPLPDDMGEGAEWQEMMDLMTGGDTYGS